MPSLKSTANEAHKTKKKSTAQKTAVDKHTLSTEFVQESEDEEGEKSDSRSVSDDDDLPENPALVPPKTNGKTQRLAATSSSESGSGSGSGSGSADESSSEEDDESSEEEVPVNPKAPESTGQAAKPSSTKTITVRVEAPSKFIPPAGFEQASIDEIPTASQLFNKSRLEERQVWYITAPASVSIASIEQMSLQAAKEGKKVYSHNGKDYGFVQNDAGDKTYTKIMVPNQDKDGYQTRSKPIDRVLHLQQIVDLPSIYDADNSAVNPSISSRATIPAKKPVRLQPKGLKMRFRPIGFGSGKPGKIGSDSGEESSTESEEIPSAPFRRPVTLDEDALKSSDVEMQDAPPPLSSKSKSKPKNTHEKSSRKEDGSLKRKHGEGEKKSHNSSSRSNIIDDTPLKKIKTKHTKSQKTMADKLSASINSSQSRPKTPRPPTSSLSLPQESPTPHPQSTKSMALNTSSFSPTPQSQNSTSTIRPFKSTPVPHLKPPILPPKSTPIPPPKQKPSSPPIPRPQQKSKSTPIPQPTPIRPPPAHSS